jgi:hypothetical protein
LFSRLGRAFDKFAKIGLDYRRKAIGQAVIQEIEKVKAELDESTYPRRVRLGVKRLDPAVKIATAALEPGPIRRGFERHIKQNNRVQREALPIKEALQTKTPR